MPIAPAARVQARVGPRGVKKGAGSRVGAGAAGRRVTSPATDSIASPAARCVTIGVRPASALASPMTVKATPNASPDPTPSATPSRTLPLPPGTKPVSARAASPARMPSAASPPGRTPRERSTSTGTVAASTEELGATMPMRATV